jgi:hypothetical protein
MNLRSMKRSFSEWRMASGEWRVAAFAIRYSRLASLAALALASAPAEAYFVPRHQGAWPAPSGASAYMPACGRLSFASQGAVQATDFHGLSHIQCTSPKWTASNLRFLFSCFYVAGTGVANPETVMPNNCIVDFATVFISGTAYPLAFGGAQSVTIPAGGFIWTDPLVNASGALVTLSPNTTYYIRSSRSAPAAGGAIPASEGPYGITRWSNPALGDGVSWQATVQTSYRTSGTVGAYSNGSESTGPEMAVATGWDGSPVYCVVGDSIGYSQADLNFLGLRGITGYLERGLDDSVSSTQRGFVNLAIVGTTPDTQSSIAKGQFQLRMQALRALPNQPCTEILSEMGQNSPPIAGTSLLAFQNEELGWWGFWHNLFPSATIFQTTFPPHAGQINNDKWTVAGASGQATDYPTGIRWQASNWLRGDCPGTVGGITCPSGPAIPSYVTVLDVTPAFQDAANLGYWKVSGFADTINTTVGSGVSSLSVAGPTAPTVGDMLAIDPGQGDVDYIQIASVTGAASPWTVGLTGGTSHAHNSGVPVSIGYSPEGTHPTSTLEMAGAAIIEAYKNSGALP